MPNSTPSVVPFLSQSLVPVKPLSHTKPTPLSKKLSGPVTHLHRVQFVSKDEPGSELGVSTQTFVNVVGGVAGFGFANVIAEPDLFC